MEKIYSGTNIENASYGLTICAERVAIGTAVSSGDKNIESIMVNTDLEEFKWPCGACLQVMLEFNENMEVFSVISDGTTMKKNIKELIPFSFTSKDLKKREEMEEKKKQFQLGEEVEIIMGVQDKKALIEFMKTLGYKNYRKEDNYFTDGLRKFKVIESSENFTKLGYLSIEPLEKKIFYLKKNGKKLKNIKKDEKTGKFKYVEFIEPNNNLIISLKKVEKYHKIEDIEDDCCNFGQFGELCIGVNNLNETSNFFKKIGFKIGDTSFFGYNFCICFDGLLPIGLHETNQFSKPGISYFFKNMINTLKTLKSKGVTFENSNFGEDNAIIKFQGQTFNLFTGDLGNFLSKFNF